LNPPGWMDAEIKIKEVDTTNDDRPKMAHIGDYWTKMWTTKIVYFLKEYQDVFSRYYKYLKGLVKEMGEIKIDLDPCAKSVKKRPSKLDHKYKEIVQKDIERMWVAGIIYPIDKSEWANPMLVEPKKHDPKKLIICVDFRGLDKLIIIDPFPTPFSEKIINDVVGHGCYSFMMDFQGTIKYLLPRISIENHLHVKILVIFI
jgi:hypothetical protein